MLAGKLCPEAGKIKMRLTKEDSDDLGFATECVTAGALTFDEFKTWIYRIIEISDDYPLFLLDIVDLENKFDYTLDTIQIVGFNPYWSATETEQIAVDGIAYRRFSHHESDAAPRLKALAALQENPQIEKRFRQMFPFVEW